MSPPSAQLAAVAEAAALAASAAQVRDRTIRVAHSDGASIRAIAAASGLSASRVHQILHRR